MNDSATEDPCPTTSEGEKKDKTALNKLPKEELLKQAEKYFGLFQIAKKKFSELNAKCTSLEEERDGAFIVLAKLKSVNDVGSIEELQEKIHGLQHNVSHHEECIRIAEEKVAEMERLKHSFEEGKREKESLKRKYIDLQEESECRKLQMQTLTETYQSFQDSIIMLNAKNEELTVEKKVLIEARDTMMSALKSAKEELTSAKSESESQSQQFRLLNEEKETLEKELLAIKENMKHAANQEIQSILQVLPEVERKILQPDSSIEFDCKHQELNDFSIKLMTEFANLRLQSEELQNSLVSATRKYEELDQSTENMQKRIQSLTKDKDAEKQLQNETEQRLVEVNASLIEENSRYLEEIDILKTEVATVSASLNNALNKIESLTNNIDIEKQIQNDTKRLVEVNASLIEENSRHLEEVDILKTEVATVSVSLNNALNKIESLTKNIDTEKQIQNDTKQHLVEANANNASLINENSRHLEEVDILKTEVATISASLNDALNKIESLTNNIDTEKQIQHDTEQRLVEANANNASLINENSRHLEEVDILKTEVATISASLNDALNKIENLTNNIDTEKQIQSDTEQRLVEANANNASLIKENSRHLDEVDILKTEVATISMSLNDALNKIEKHNEKQIQNDTEQRLVVDNVDNASLIQENSRHLEEIGTLKTEVATISTSLNDALNKIEILTTNIDTEKQIQNDMEQRLIETNANNASLIEESSRHSEEVDNLKTEVAALSVSLSNALNNKEMIVSTLKAACNNLANGDSEALSPSEIVNTLISNYRHAVHKAGNLEEKTEELSQKCNDYEQQIHILSDQIDIFTREKIDMESQLNENDVCKNRLKSVEKERDSFQADNSVLSNKHEEALREIEILKQQLDEYENDIQKHQNLEQENISLNEMLKEVENENYKLNGLYDDKCIEVNDITCALNTLIESLRTKLGKFDASMDEDTKFREVFILQSLFEDFVSELNSDRENLENFAVKLEDSMKEKSSIENELNQILDLKQFLEYENIGLREEIFQLKSSENNNTPDESIGPVEVNKKDAAVEAVFFYQPQEVHRQSFSEMSGISEWGYAGDCSPNVDEGNKDKMNELQEENKRLSSLLDVKSGLTDKIHCEVDNLLSKVEDLNVEMQEKDSDLMKALQTNANLKKEIVDLRNTIAFLQDVINRNKSISSEARKMKDLVEKTHKGFQMEYQSLSRSTEEIVTHVQAKYADCYALLVEYKFKNLDLEDKKLYLINNCSQLEAAIIWSLEFLMGKYDKVLSENSMSVSDIGRTFSVEDSNFMQEFSSNIDMLKNALKLISSHDQKENEKCTEIPLNENVTGQELCLSCDQMKNQLSESAAKLNKLKAVAIKIKKESNEVSQKCNGLEVEKEKLTSKIETLMKEIDQHRQYAQNYHNLQCEYDKIQDENEKIRMENKTFQNDLASTLAELNNSKQSLSDRDLEAKKKNDALDAIEKEKTVYKGKMSDADSKLIIAESKYQDSLKKIQELTAEIDKLQKEKAKLLSDKEGMSKKMEEALMETKQHSLLDLEMADYERTISELTEQVQKKFSEMTELKDELEACKEKIQAQEDQIKFCENHRITEEKRADGFKLALEDNRKELSILRDCESSLRSQFANVTSKVEVLSLQEQEYKVQLAQVSGEVERMKDILRSSDESHQRIVQSLNTKISNLQQDMLLANKEVENVKQDFENYKIRVHTVLKQQKTTAPLSPSDMEVKEKLEAQNEKLKLQLKDVSEKLQALKLESDSQLEEHDHLQQRHNKVVEELEAKDRYWNHRLEQIIEERNKLQGLVESIMSEQSLKNEMLASTYKKQIKLIQEENKNLILGLQKQLDTADIEIARLQREHQKNVSSSSASAMGQDENFNAFDMSSQERQECEGSECTEGRDTPIRHLSLATIPTSGFLPLEKLLQSPPEPQTPTSTISNQDSEKLSFELNSSWKKIDHLSELLNESEANNLRLGEQVRVLKEEIRREERNKQREEHAKNMEYLKNVFIKFATLESGNEKARLVPVLNTMLKLSPEETRQLKDVSGELDPTAASKDGWASYLHRWSGMM